MPVTHLIIVDLRPGVQSIQVQYKYQSAETWTNYNEGQRIPGGVDVKFTATTYPNFTLTEWKAYYSDEYDDTVDIPLTSVTGESSWTFTLPSADVYIRCEAVSNPIPGTHEWPPVDLGRTEIFTIDYLSDLESVYNRFIYLAQRSGDNIPFPTLSDVVAAATLAGPSFANVIANAVTGNLIGIACSPSGPTSGVYIRTLLINSVPGGYSLPFNTSKANPPSAPSGGTGVQMLYDHRNNTFSDFRIFPDRPPMFPGTNFNNDICEVIGGIANNLYINNGQGNSSPPLTENSIRYIMSPENSGEVDASAPSEFVQGTTEFTFKWRIKAAYEFKRLTPFAVGDTPTLEDDVTYSMQYNGDTRTYTFTVSSIPDWAKGVRVLIETIMTGDPSSPIGNNGSDGPIGGNGTFDDTSDEVPLPGIPEGVSAPDTGFVTLFRPTISQIQDLSNYMWSNISEFIENLQKIFTNPMDYIISLASFPVTPDVGPNKNIYVGNFLTNIQMPPITRQFYEFNCGTINVAEYFGSFLDYAPNTRARIMLPFIGDADLSVNEIMGKTLHLWYRIDLLSGSCVAVLTIDNSVYYQWTGNCSIQIPVTASDFSRLYAGIARVGVTAAAVAAGGAYLGALASAASGWNASNAGWHSVSGDFGQGYSPSPNLGVPALPPSYGQLSTDLSTDSGPQLNMGDYVSYTPPMQIPSKKSRALAAAAGGSFIGHNMMNAIPRVQHAGGMSGNIGIMGNRTPFIVLEYPNVSMPENYKHVFGYPSNMYKVLGDLAGYTKCKQVLFESTKATDDEYEMVIEALKGGVYL